VGSIPTGPTTPKLLIKCCPKLLDELTILANPSPLLPINPHTWPPYALRAGGLEALLGPTGGNSKDKSNELFDTSIKDRIFIAGDASKNGAVSGRSIGAPMMMALTIWRP
jgi:hypothetical protein